MENFGNKNLSYDVYIPHNFGKNGKFRIFLVQKSDFRTFQKHEKHIFSFVVFDPDIERSLLTRPDYPRKGQIFGKWKSKMKEISI